MLGITFWKHAANEEQAEAPRALRAFDRRRARKRIQCGLVFAGAAISMVAIAAGFPVTGLVIYLISILPFVLMPA